MSVVTVEIHRDIRDPETIHQVKSKELLLSGSFEVRGGVSEVVNTLIDAYSKSGVGGGDGYEVSFSESRNGSGFVAFTSYWGFELLELREQLTSKFPLSDKVVEFNTNNQLLSIRIPEQYPLVTTDDIAEIENILGLELKNNDYEIISSTNLSAWGASGSFTDFLISIFSEVTVGTIGKLYEYLLSKKIQIDPNIDFADLRKELLNKYQIDISSFKLTSLKENTSHIGIKMASRYELLNFKIDKNNKVVEFDRKQLKEFRF